MPTVVIGTAGHIDHGKTSLLRALTGIDADRLPEERSRGMTIDIGYAHMTFEDGVELDFVDVPGHDRLIGNMLVGAGEIDAALLVVAADDGPRPQTLEHVELLDALGIAAGFAVITKIDAVEDPRVADVAHELVDLLARTSLAGAPVLAASSVTGRGIDAVRHQLRAVRESVAGENARHGEASRVGAPRLAIDRAFAVKGRGAVVTGTLRSGAIRAGMTLRREPGGDDVRVREVQVHGAARDVHDGGRAALNLAGPLAAGGLARGQVLTTDAGIVATDQLLVDLRTTGASPAVRATTRLRLHIGTDQVDGTMQRIAARAGTGLLRLERPTATFVGDRGVLREPASGALVAGLRVLDPRPPRGVSRRRLTDERLRVLADTVTRDDDPRPALLELHGARRAAGVGAGSLELASDVVATLEEAALVAVGALHREAPLSPGLPLPRARATLLRGLRSLATVDRADADAATAAVDGLITRLVRERRLVQVGDALRDPAQGDAAPAELTASMDRLLEALDVAAPPSLAAAAEQAGCPPDGIRALAAAGRIVRLSPDLAWASTTFHRLAALALDGARVAPLTPAEFRDATGTSRKYALAILEDLDRRGILVRTPEGHIPGPRAPRPESEPERDP